MAEAAFEEVSVIGFKDGQAGVEQLAFRNDDDVEAWRDVMSTENLSYQSFSSISLHRAAQFPGRRDAQAADILLVGQDEDRHEPAVRPRPAIVDALELRAATNALFGTEFQSLFVADREPLAPLGAPALQDQPAIFRAHPHQKSMRALAVSGVGLERPFPLHATPSESGETSMVTDLFKGCQCACVCATVASLSGTSGQV